MLDYDGEPDSSVRLTQYFSTNVAPTPRQHPNKQREGPVLSLAGAPLCTVAFCIASTD